MGSDWKEVTLASISSDVSYGYTASASNDKLGPKFLRITDIQGGRVDWNSVPHCSIDKKYLTKYLLKEGDILIARTGNSTGENFLFSESNTTAVFASYLIRFEINQKTACPQFIWYHMRSSNWWKFINSAKTGSAQAGANAKVLGTYKIKLPPLAEQEAIANLLKSLDDKIELNRQICKTLEGIANTLFKSWFIDFDPVKAKAAGRNPEGLSPEIANLFPDSFVESTLGQIPAGWEIAELGKIARNIKKNIKSSSETEILPYVPIDCITSNSLALQSHMPGILAKTSLIKFEKWQIIFGAMRPYFHKVCIAPCAGTTRTTAFILDPINSDDFGFFLTTVFQKTTIDYATNTSQGSTIPYAVWEDGMAKMPIILPPVNLRKFYNLATIKNFEKIVSITKQNETLSSIRNLLLPRLISGSVKLKDIQDL